MPNALGSTTERVIHSAVLAGRIMLAGIFIHEGSGLALNLTAALSAMGKLGVPAPLAVATILLQIAAGFAILGGWQTRAAAIGLGLFCIATAVLFHTNFAVRNELLHFEKDLAIAGGLLVLAVHGAGIWSLDHFLTSRPKQANPAPAGVN